MIRINLLSGERRVEKAASAGLGAGQKVALLGTALLVLTVLGLGLRYWMLTSREATLASDIVAAQREEARLSVILKQVAEFEARRDRLQQREALVEELRKGQSAPVHMVDQVSRALPDMLWLTSMKQEGYDVTMEGRCLSLTALSDFVGNLESSRYFRKSVEILDSEVEPGENGGPDLITFSVKGTFQMSGIDAPADDPKSKRPARRGGARG